MARVEFKFIDDDGQVFRRFSRSLPVEAWLESRDLDDPEAEPIITAIQLRPDLALAAVLPFILNAVNSSLRFRETQAQLVEPGESKVVGVVGRDGSPVE